MPPAVKKPAAATETAAVKAKIQKKPGITVKKVIKTPAKAESQSGPLLVRSEPVETAPTVKVKVETKDKLEATSVVKPELIPVQEKKPQAKQEKPKQQVTVEITGASHSTAEIGKEPVSAAKSNTEANGDGKKVSSAVGATQKVSQKPKGSTVSPKIKSPPSSKKQKKTVGFTATPEAPVQTEIKGATPGNDISQSKDVKKIRSQVGSDGDGKKDVANSKESASDQKVKDADAAPSKKKEARSETLATGEAIKHAKAKTELQTGLEIEAIAVDEEYEEIVEEDGEEQEQEGEEDQGEGLENEESIDNEDEDEIEEEDEEEGDTEEAGGENIGFNVIDEHPEFQEPRPLTERQKRKKLEIFIGGLDNDATEGDVKKAVEHVGDVVEVRLMKNPQTGKSKGYAFVRFATAAQATRAITEIGKTQIRGRLCGIAPSDHNDVLFLGNINRLWKKEQVEDKLKEYGIEGIEEFTLMEDPHNKGVNRGFAFIELATHNDANRAYKRLQMPDAVFGLNRSAKIAWAEPEKEPDEAVMSQVKSVFVDGMPAVWSEEKVKQQFGKYGEIERVVLARNMPSARRKDFAFVNFSAREAAIACIDAFKESDLFDGENKIKVKITLAKPAPKIKPKAVKGVVRGDHFIGQPRLWRSEDVAHPRMDFRRSGRGGRSFSLTRDDGRMPDRVAKRGYEYGSPHKGTWDSREYEDEDSFHFERSRDRRFSGPPPRSSRVVSRDAYLRHEELRPIRASYSSRPNNEYSRRDDFRDDYPPPRTYSLPERQSSRPTRQPPLPRDDGYSSRDDQGLVYEHDMDAGYDRARNYTEAGSGLKRSFSSLDDDRSYSKSGSRGYPRARIDYGNVSPPPSQFDADRTPLGRSGAGRTPFPALSAGHVPRSSLGSYDQPGGGLGGSSYGDVGASSLYGSGNYDYGSAISGASDYIPSGGEARGTSLHSSLYGGRPGGYTYSGAGSGSYY